MINAVIDISHHNGHPNFMSMAGIVGVIHKATQGLAYADPMFKINRPKILSAGLLFGAYHFGVNASGKDQAEKFVRTVRPTEETLLALDYEPNKSPQTTMTLAQAREFVVTVARLTGRYPGLYSGHLIKEQLGGKPKDTILSQCWLWLAQYAPAPAEIPKTWPTWTLWQYTDRGIVPGIGFCDRNKFNGDLDGLKRLWGASPVGEKE